MITSIPIAALITSGVAVFLFIFKEIRESVKKKKSNEVMLSGLCYMIKEQVRFNKTIIDELLKIREKIDNVNYESWCVELIGENSYVNFKDKEGATRGILIVMPKYDFFEKEIKELSMLNKELFDSVIKLISVMQEAYIHVTALLVMLRENKKGSKSLNEFITNLDNKINNLYIPTLLSVSNRCDLITKKPN